VDHSRIGVESMFTGLSDTVAVTPIVEGPQVGSGFVESQKTVATHIREPQMTGVTVTK
jgi:hypothetical protein